MPFRRLLTGDPDKDAVIAQALRYNQQRMAEALLACLMVTYSATLLHPTPTFTAPSYKVIASYVTETQAGSAGVIVGLLRLVALWINGHRRETPIIRAIGCVAGAIFWTALSVGFVMAITSTLLPSAVGIYPVLAAFEVFCSSWAGRDVFILDTFGIRQRSREQSRDTGQPDARSNLA